MAKINFKALTTVILHQQSRENQGKRSECHISFGLLEGLVSRRGITSKQCLPQLRALINETGKFDLVDVNSRPSDQPNIKTKDPLKNLDLLKHKLHKVETQEWEISVLKGKLSF